jgi:predicted RNA-binding Zn-ribbon protein involved in translation (DUF1610 family)
MKATDQLNKEIQVCSVCKNKFNRDETSVCPDCDDVVCGDCEAFCSCSESWECSRCGGDLLDCMCI